MAEKIAIEIYRKKDAEDFTAALADPESRMKLGSGAAMTAAVASADLERAAAILAKEDVENQRLAYVLRNAGILRDYMVRLIDEDVKAHGPLRRAMKEQEPRAIEAARQTAIAICSEVAAMMGKALEFIEELAGTKNAEAACYLAGAMDSAMGAVRSAMRYKEYFASLSSDETYRYIISRENELTLSSYEELCRNISAKMSHETN